MRVYKETMKEEYTITKKDWESVKAIMEQYNRDSGFVDVVTKGGNPKLTFFDSDPKINNVSALYVTKEDVDSYVSAY